MELIEELKGIQQHFEGVAEDAANDGDFDDYRAARDCERTIAKAISLIESHKPRAIDVHNPATWPNLHPSCRFLVWSEAHPVARWEEVCGLNFKARAIRQRWRYWMEFPPNPMPADDGDDATDDSATGDDWQQAAQCKISEL